jgi:hypothetical protein
MMPRTKPNTKPTIILIHGAFHGPECFKTLVPILRDAGYSCIDDVTLPGAAGDATITLQDDVNAARDRILKVLDICEDKKVEGNNCIIVVHSYGAIPVSQAVKGLDSKSRGDRTAVQKIIYLSCIIPEVGQSQASTIMGWQKLEGLTPKLHADIKV